MKLVLNMTSLLVLSIVAHMLDECMDKLSSNNFDREVAITPQQNEEILDLAGFAQKMLVTKNTVHRWIERGKIVAGVHYMWDGGRVYRFNWGPDLIQKIMRHWHPNPAPPRPRLKSKKGGNRQLYRLKA